jgi:hypothetical protein
MLKRFSSDRVTQNVRSPTPETGKVNIGRPIVEIKLTKEEAVPASSGTLPKAIQELGRLAKWSL